jgi:hypothetical protein
VFCSLIIILLFLFPPTNVFSLCSLQRGAGGRPSASMWPPPAPLVVFHFLSFFAFFFSQLCLSPLPARTAVLPLRFFFVPTDKLITLQRFPFSPFFFIPPTVHRNQYDRRSATTHTFSVNNNNKKKRRGDGSWRAWLSLHHQQPASSCFFFSLLPFRFSCVSHPQHTPFCAPRAVFAALYVCEPLISTRALLYGSNAGCHRLPPVF